MLMLLTIIDLCYWIRWNWAGCSSELILDIVLIMSFLQFFNHLKLCFFFKIHKSQSKSEFIWISWYSKRLFILFQIVQVEVCFIICYWGFHITTQYTIWTYFNWSSTLFQIRWLKAVFIANLKSKTKTKTKFM